MQQSIRSAGRTGGDRGECGACTVHVAGRRVLACMTLAVTVGDAEITTIEGLAAGGELHRVQRAFLDHDAFQCGYCTPGQVMSAVAVIAEGHAGSAGGRAGRDRRPGHAGDRGGTELVNWLKEGIATPVRLIGGRQTA